MTLGWESWCQQAVLVGRAWMGKVWDSQVFAGDGGFELGNTVLEIRDGSGRGVFCGRRGHHFGGGGRLSH